MTAAGERAANGGDAVVESKLVVNEIFGPT